MSYRTNRKTGGTFRTKKGWLCPICGYGTTSELKSMKHSKVHGIMVPAERDN